MTLNMFAPITKVDEVQRLVYGTLVAEEVDKSGEIFDYASSKAHIEEWSGAFAKATDGKSLGNLRAMHGKVAAGKFTQLACNDVTKSVEVCAKVVDDAEWNKVVEGVYTGFSIGGSYVKKWKDGEHHRYTAKPSEGSLADNPCGNMTMFSMIKADGTTEMRKFHVPAAVVDAPVAKVESSAEAVTAPAVETETPELEQVWKAKDGTTYATKALAKAHNDEVAKAAADAADPLLSAPAAREAAIAAVAKAETSAAAPPAAVEPPKAPEPAPVAKTAEERFEVLRKGLGTVGRLANLIQDLSWLADSAGYEAEQEGDSSSMPATLKASVASLCEALKSMVEEETAELTADDDVSVMLEMAARPAGADALAKLLGDKAPAYLAKLGAKHSQSDKEHMDAAHEHIKALGVSKCAGMGADKAAIDAMAKAGARHSKATAGYIQDAHDSMTKAGADCPAKDDTAAEKHEHTGDLAKVLSDNELLKAELAKSNAAFGDIAARLAKIEAQPVPHPSERGPGTLRVVSKAEDAAGAVNEAISKMTTDEITAMLVQAARANGRQVSR